LGGEAWRLLKLTSIGNISPGRCICKASDLPCLSGCFERLRSKKLLLLLLGRIDEYLVPKPNQARSFAQVFHKEREYVPAR